MWDPTTSNQLKISTTALSLTAASLSLHPATWIQHLSYWLPFLQECCKCPETLYMEQASNLNFSHAAGALVKTDEAEWRAKDGCGSSGCPVREIRLPLDIDIGTTQRPLWHPYFSSVVSSEQQTNVIRIEEMLGWMPGGRWESTQPVIWDCHNVYLEWQVNCGHLHTLKCVVMLHLKMHWDTWSFACHFWWVCRMTKTGDCNLRCTKLIFSIFT